MEPEKHIDVLVLTQHDWANSAYRYTECLKSLGLNVTAFKGETHPFGYPNQLPIHPALSRRAFSTYHYVPQLQPYAEKAKVIHYFTSTFIDCAVDPWTTHIVMQHGGTVYRLNHENINGFYNHFVDKTIIQCPDLLGLGANDEHLIYYPIQVENIEPRFERADPEKIIIGHFPRHPEVKGTDTIMKVLESLNGEFSNKFEVKFSTDSVPWKENLSRMAACDVIIECCKPEQEGRKFGEWGNTALEAAALGKLVISNTLSEQIYWEEYGDLGLLVANDGNELKKRITGLLSWPYDFIAEARRQSRLWAETNHSMASTAKRLWNKVYKHFFEGEKNG